MKPIPFMVGFIATISCSLPLVAEDISDEDKLTRLRNSAQSYVDAFNKRDAEAIAKLYLPAGELTLGSGETISGREEIEAFYEARFEADTKSQAAIEAGAVRFITPGIAVEDGTFHITLESGEVASFDYTSIQVQQEDGSWLTASVRDTTDDVAPPSEKLIGLSWLVGDWAIQREGATTWLSYDWSADGPYIDGRALTEEAGMTGIAATSRIGWNANRQQFVSWSFDEAGGYLHSEWTHVSEDSWMIRAYGVTADGESIRSTQGIDRNDSGFKWSIRDLVIDGVLQPAREAKVVPRPPQPATASE